MREKKIEGVKDKTQTETYGINNKKTTDFIREKIKINFQINM